MRRIVMLIATLVMTLGLFSGVASTAHASGGYVTDNDHGSNWAKSKTYLKVYRNNDNKYTKIYPGQVIPGWARYYKAPYGYTACHVSPLKIRTGGQSCTTAKTKLPTYDYTYTVKK